MIPVIAEVVVIGIFGMTMVLFLGDKGPSFIELDLAGLGGKRPRVRRGTFWRVGPLLS